MADSVEGMGTVEGSRDSMFWIRVEGLEPYAESNEAVSSLASALRAGQRSKRTLMTIVRCFDTRSGIEGRSEEMAD